MYILIFLGILASACCAEAKEEAFTSIQTVSLSSSTWKDQLENITTCEELTIDGHQQPSSVIVDYLPRLNVASLKLENFKCASEEDTLNFFLDDTAIKFPIGLKKLAITSSNMTCIPFAVARLRLPSLEILDLSNNQINRIAPWEWPFFKGIPTIYLDHNKIKTLPPLEIFGNQEVYLYGNPFDSGPIRDSARWVVGKFLGSGRALYDPKISNAIALYPAWAYQNKGKLGLGAAALSASLIAKFW